MGILALNLETTKQILFGEMFVLKRLKISIHYTAFIY